MKAIEISTKLYPLRTMNPKEEEIIQEIGAILARGITRMYMVKEENEQNSTAQPKTRKNRARKTTPKCKTECTNSY